MRPLKALIVCVSTHHNNTRRVAEALADVLDADIVTPQELRVEQLAEYDLLGFGSGIHFGRHAEPLRKFAAKLPYAQRKVFVFSAAGIPILCPLFHVSLKRVLRSRGCEIVGEFTCRGWDSVGPLAWFGGINRHHPDAHDLERAREFARSLTDRARVIRPAAVSLREPAAR